MLFLTEQDVQKLRELYTLWLNEAFNYEKQEGGVVTSCSACLSEVKRVKGKISREAVNEWLKGLPLSVPFVTYNIVQMSLEVLSSLPMVLSQEEDYYAPIHIENPYGKVLLCHTFTEDDWEELDTFYWNCLTDIIFEGWQNEN